MPMYYEMQVRFHMKNGSTFSVEWSETRFPATFEDPEEVDSGEYLLYIDSDLKEEDELPKGLLDLAEAMYNEPHNAKFELEETYLGRAPVRPY